MCAVRRPSLSVCVSLLPFTYIIKRGGPIVRQQSARNISPLIRPDLCRSAGPFSRFVQRARSACPCFPLGRADRPGFRLFRPPPSRSARKKKEEPPPRLGPSALHIYIKEGGAARLSTDSATPQTELRPAPLHIYIKRQTLLRFRPACRPYMPRRPLLPSPRPCLPPRTPR